MAKRDKENDSREGMRSRGRERRDGRRECDEEADEMDFPSCCHGNSGSG